MSMHQENLVNTFLHFFTLFCKNLKKYEKDNFPHWQSTGYKLLQLYKHLGNRAERSQEQNTSLFLTLARKLQFASPHCQRSAPGDPCGLVIATVRVCRAAGCTGTISDLSPLFLYRELSYAVIGRTGRRKCNILESHVKSA
jgi:hypothetical protein